MYKIYIQDLEVHAIIGILDFERQKSQSVVVNVVIKYKKNNEQFINYADVVSKIEWLLIENRYKLLEDALCDIIDTIYNDFNQIKSIKLRLDKPQILDNCIVGVELLRKF